MSTKQFYDLSEIKAGSYFNNFKTIIETPFYGNNVYEVETPVRLISWPQTHLARL